MVSSLCASHVSTSLCSSPGPVASDQVCVKRMTTALTKEWQLPDPRGVTRLGKALKVKFE